MAVAIPYTNGQGETSSSGAKTLLVCLVTSRKNDERYVLPKGGIESGEDGRQAAVREMWEEGEWQGPSAVQRLHHWSAHQRLLLLLSHTLLRTSIHVRQPGCVLSVKTSPRSPRLLSSITSRTRSLHRPTPLRQTLFRVLPTLRTRSSSILLPQRSTGQRKRSAHACGSPTGRHAI